MNDVETGELDEDGTIDRQIELVGGDDVVLGVGLGTDEAERIVCRNAGDIAPPEAAVRARIMGDPLELLRGDANDGGLALRRKRPDARRPNRDGVDEEQ